MSTLTAPELLELAPTALRSRSQPYRGDSVTASIAAMDPGDAETVRALYRFLGDLQAAARGEGDELAALREVLARHDHGGLSRRVQALGGALRAGEAPLALRKAYHDLRGGSLSGLMMHLDVVEAGEAERGDVGRIFILVRDHLKIMRNALPDLDPEGYARDLCPREHDVGLIVEKWSRVAYRPEGAPRVRVEVACEFAGGVSECCMEFAALDRVLYNLINNASRFAVDGEVRLDVLPVREGRETDLRFVVSNRIAADHRARLVADLGGECSRVFAGGYTTGGHGVGLQICGDFITHGYGLSSLGEALTGGYLGARIVRDFFVAWFHWPARRG